MKKLLALALLLASTAQAQDFRHRYFHYDQVFDATAPFTIAANTSDGADTNRICIQGGGNNGCVSGVRGAFLYMGGEQDGTLGGSWRLSTGTAGTDKSGNLYGDTFTFNSAAGANRWTFTADLTQNATNGGNIVMTKAASGYVNGLSAVHADWGTMAPVSIFNVNPYKSLYGGNNATGVDLWMMKSRATDGSADTGVNSGDEIGTIKFFGSDGAAFRQAATVAAYVDATAGSSDMPGRLVFSTTPDGSATPAERFRIESDGDLVQEATNGGNLIFQKDGTGVIDSTEPTNAAGSTITDATVIAANVTFVASVGAGEGVKFIANPIGGQSFKIYNTENAVLRVYPGEAGDQINALGAGNPVGLAAYASLDCHASSASQIWCGVQANVSAP